MKAEAMLRYRFSFLDSVSTVALSYEDCYMKLDVILTNHGVRDDT
jgi:hypothetical protein